MILGIIYYNDVQSHISVKTKEKRINVMQQTIRNEILQYAKELSGGERKK